MLTAPLPAGPDLDARVRLCGESILDAMGAVSAPSPFTLKGAQSRLLAYAMNNPAFKTGLFRFVDALPSLSTPAEVVDHLHEYLGDGAVELGLAAKTALGATSLAPVWTATAVRTEVESMAREFVVGETVEELVAHYWDNAALGLGTSVDLLTESVLSEPEADEALERNLQLLDGVTRAQLRMAGPPELRDRRQQRPFCPINLSLKVSSLSPDFHAAAPERSLGALARRLRLLLRAAANNGAGITFDMETYDLKELTLMLFESVYEEEEFRSAPAPSIAIQAYLLDSEQDLRRLLGWARAHHRRIGVRLVKGAYWDFETVNARQHDWPSPVFTRKSETDAEFEKLTILLLDNIDIVEPGFGTHNVRSCAHAIAQAERRGIDRSAYEFQALYGMARGLELALIGLGYRVREYCPVGELLPGMSYLVRRLLENTSNQSWVRLQASGRLDREQLLAPPSQAPVSRPRSVRPTRPRFTNTPLTDFARAEGRERMRAALAGVAGSFGRRWPLSIDGARAQGERWVASVNPARPEQIIGFWAQGSEADADAAVAAARAALPRWASASAETRAQILEQAAELMEQRRFELAAYEVYETGKPWLEADADVAEAIDYCRYYAWRARRLGRARTTQRTAGEDNRELWAPRGVAVVIAPWNFPLAIPCGMTTAALVTGNTVVLKPAEQSSVLGALLVELLHEAGVPGGVLGLVTGPGETVGAHLVAHPGVDLIAFTGSRKVGLEIWETAGHTRAGQSNLKKVICEMGGKNAMIIDSDADFDQAIPAVIQSAFGYAGQKCSALSRLVVLEPAYDAFMRRFLAACASIVVGDPSDPSTLVGPVIEADAQSRILSIIERTKHQATLAFQGQVPSSDGYWVPPTVFTDVARAASIARDEIFGPVVAVMKASDLGDAFALVNSSEYGLTAGLFSRSPSALERARRELLVGNLYLNRAITGAMVGRQPFGGFKMSGGGTKAGGRDYLRHFVWPRVISENTMRRGFAPE